MKRRSKSQKIGTHGENAFRDFAARHHLIVTKADEDFGTDFFCVLETPPDRAGHSDVTGHVLGAFVRATIGRRARIVVERSDVEHLLGARFPIFIVMVHRPRSADEKIYFRFVDQTVAVRFAEFLQTGQKSLTLPSSDLLEEDQFRAQVKVATGAGFLEGVRIQLVSRSLEAVLPKSRIEVHRTADGQITIVEMDQFGDHLSIEGKAQQKLLHTAVFGLQEHLPERLALLPMKPQVVTWIRELPQPIAFIGPVTGYTTTLKVEGSAGSASCDFEARRSEDHSGFTHPSGFAITISKATRRGNEFVHYLNAEIDEAATSPLSNFPDLWDFLEKCTPDARISEGEFSLNVDNISWLPQCGFFARYLRSIQGMHDWPPGTWVMADALQYETLNTLAWFGQVKQGLEWLTGYGLLNGEESDATSEDVSFHIPVCANLPRSLSLVWLTVKGRMFTSDERVRGFRLLEILSWKLDFRPERLTKSDFPELVFYTGWPTIRIPEHVLGAPVPEEWNFGVIFDGPDDDEVEKK